MIIHAELHEAVMYGYRIVGNIYKDSKGRFTDGTEVTTSYIKYVVEDLDTGDIIVMTNNTNYKIVGDHNIELDSLPKEMVKSQ